MIARRIEIWFCLWRQTNAVLFSVASEKEHRRGGHSQSGHRQHSRDQAARRARLDFGSYRELALQVAEQDKHLSERTDLCLAAVFGGIPLRRQTKLLKQGVELVIATLGRLLDHVAQKNISF